LSLASALLHLLAAVYGDAPVTLVTEAFAALIEVLN
jgi:hypothetical protein